MPETIVWTSNLAVTGGPKLPSSLTLNVTAYDKLEVVIPGEAKADPTEPASHANNVGGLTAVSVDVQPASSSDLVDLLAITADQLSEDVIYTVTGGAANVVLDAPQILAGGAVALLQAAPETLEFKNGLGVGNDVTVTILVGRQAA